MPRRRELPRAFVEGSSDDDSLAGTEADEFTFVGGDIGRPDTALQALMEAKPLHEPEVSREERLQLREVVCDALDTLSEKELWIFDALYVRGLSLRECGRELAIPHTTIKWWSDRMKLRLQEKLEVEPLIIEYLNPVPCKENG